MKTRISLVPNLDDEIRRKKNKNPIRFYWEEEMKTKQCYNNKMYPQLMLNILKEMRNFTCIYTHWALNLRKFQFLRNFQFTCGPCVPMCEL